ncbi:hypothetical protein Tsubulata_040959, partial [Turnera subulata]
MKHGYFTWVPFPVPGTYLVRVRVKNGKKTSLGVPETRKQGRYVRGTGGYVRGTLEVRGGTLEVRELKLEKKTLTHNLSYLYEPHFSSLTSLTSHRRRLSLSHSHSDRHRPQSSPSHRRRDVATSPCIPFPSREDPTSHHHSRGRHGSRPTSPPPPRSACSRLRPPRAAPATSLRTLYLS